MYATKGWGFTRAARDATSVELTDDEYGALMAGQQTGQQLGQEGVGAAVRKSAEDVGEGEADHQQIGR